MANMVSIADNVRTLMAERKLSIKKLSELSGVNRTTLTQLLSGHTKSTHIDTLQSLADFFGVSLDTLTKNVSSGKVSKHELSQPRNTASVIREIKSRVRELEEVSKMTEFLSIPVVGYIPAGRPIAQEEADMGSITVTRDVVGIYNEHDLFALIVSGDSLQGDGILDGDFIIYDPNFEFIPGKIYAIDTGDDEHGHEYAVKHLRKHNDHLTLESSNPEFPPMDIQQVKIVGRVIALNRKF